MNRNENKPSRAAVRLTISVSAYVADDLRRAQARGMEINVSERCSQAISKAIDEWRADRKLFADALKALEATDVNAETVQRIREALNM